MTCGRSVLSIVAVLLPESSRVSVPPSAKKRGQTPLIAGGEGGIRTHEGLLTLAGFQDQCIQPLCHLSTRKNAANRTPRQRPKAQAAPACVARAVPACGLPLLVFKTSAFNRSATSPHEKTLPIEDPDNALKLKPHRPVSPGLSLHPACPCWFSRPVHSTALPPLRETLAGEDPKTARRFKPRRAVSHEPSPHAACPCWFSRPVHSTALPALRQRSGRRRIVRGASIGFNRASH